MQANDTQNIIHQLRKSIQLTEQQLRNIDSQYRQREREAKDHIRQIKSDISDKKRNLHVLRSLESKVHRGDQNALYQ